MNCMRVRVVVAILLSVGLGAFAQPGTSLRVSVSTGGLQGNDESGGLGIGISASGRFVVFESAASTLVPGDTNGYRDVYLRDCQLGTTELVSVVGNDEGLPGDSIYPHVTPDGRYVVYSSLGWDQVPGDTNGCSDIFLRDRVVGVTECVSVASSGEQANDHSFWASISADGRYVLFWSYASNLVSDDTNGAADTFVRDRLLGTTERVSVSSSGEQGDRHSYAGSITPNGRFVAFNSLATNLVEGDTAGKEDIFVRDRLLGTTERVSISTYSEQANNECGRASLSADGRFVAFESWATNLVPNDTNLMMDIFVRDRLNGTTERVSVTSSGMQGTGSGVGAWTCSVSAEGRFVVFTADFTNLVPGDWNECADVFVKDRQSGAIERCSLAYTGFQPDKASYRTAISAEGRFVAFASDATNLVPGDTNVTTDVFRFERQAQLHNVSGIVRFGNVSAGFVLPEQVEMRLEWNGVPFGVVDCALAPGGQFALSLAAGHLTLSVRHSHWLRRTVVLDATLGDVTDVEVDLVNGDANLDDSVNLLDLNSVLGNFGLSGVPSDLDEDGLVALPDLLIVLVHFGWASDP